MSPSFLTPSAGLCQPPQDKPFYKIFIEITQDKMGHLIPDVVRVTGLTDKQVRAIITRRVKDTPLCTTGGLDGQHDGHAGGDQRRGP